VQLPTIILVALLVGGILAMRFHRLAAALAGVSAVLVVVIDLISRANLGTALRDASVAAGTELSTPEIDWLINEDIGFWITTAGLVALTVYNLTASPRDRPTGVRPTS
jgi:hypothetical protein